MTLTIIDDAAAEVVVRDEASERRFPLASAEGFGAVSRAWLRAGAVRGRVTYWPDAFLRRVA